MSSTINLYDGITIRYDEGTLIIDGLGKGSSGQRNKEENGKEIHEDKVIKGDVDGNIIVKGNNVTIIVEGDVDGNIVGAGKVEVKGDIDGNVVGCG